MKTLRLILGAIVLAGALGAVTPVGAEQAAAQNPAPAAITPVTPTPAALAPIPLPPLATQLGKTLQTLVGVPTPVPTAAPAATPTPIPDKDEDMTGQVNETFATDLLDTLAQAVDNLKAHSQNVASNATAWADFSDWLEHQSSDPRRQAAWKDIGQDLTIIVGLPLLAGIAVVLLLLPLRLNLRRNSPQDMTRRVSLWIGLFVLRLVPVCVFLGLSLLLLDQNETHRLPRFVILNVIYALALGYSVQQLLRGFFAPNTAHLRFVPMSTHRAAFAYSWLSAFNFIIVYSYFLIDVAGILRVPGTAIAVFQNIFALILTIMAIVVITRTRAGVAAMLRGRIETHEGETSFVHVWRGGLARHWHQLAIIYLIISLAVTWLGVDNGFALMLRGTIISILILVVARFAFVMIDAWKAPKAGGAALLHRQILAFIMRPAIWIAAGLGIAATWGVPLGSFAATTSGQRAVSAAMSIILTLFILTVFYELLHASIERHLNRRDAEGKLPLASARARTLLPMVRNIIFIFFCAIAVLMCLSAIGVNIAPLLAGAGVIGVAVGFGSQSLVKDLLTGLFIVAENTIAVGDVVKIGDFGGLVETLSIRTIRLRDSDGSLHILPFSEVSKITNMTRGFAYALVDIPVARDSDLDHVMRVLREVGAQLQEDPVFKRVITEPMEVFGVDKIGESSITVRARMRTRPGKQWDVKAQLLQRIMLRFDTENIVIPFPTVVHVNKTGEKPVV